MKTRIIHTKIWEDEWFCTLSDDGQKLFLYLITNRRINMCGIYECSDRVILFDAKLTPQRLEKAKAELVGRASFFSGWVYVHNAQRLGGYSGRLCDSGIEKEMRDIPQAIKKCFIEGKCDTPYKPHEGVLKGHEEEEETTALTTTSSRLWEDLTPKQQMVAFVENHDCIFGKQGNEQAALVQDMVLKWLMATWKVSESIARTEMGKFLLYWTEPTGNGKKQFWQTKKTFEVKRRFVTWMTNKHATRENAGGQSNKYQVDMV